MTLEDVYYVAWGWNARYGGEEDGSAVDGGKVDVGLGPHRALIRLALALPLLTGPSSPGQVRSLLNSIRPFEHCILL
jgi:hypothetical protein